MASGWTPQVLELLEKLRINCINLHHYHRKSFFYWKSYSKYFRIPVLVMSSINATASVGLQQFVNQKWISLTTCIIGMLIGTITAVEMYLNVTSNMDLELKQSKDYYTLAIDIYRITRLPLEQRGEDGNSYLAKKYASYYKLAEASSLLYKKLKVDTLGHIPHHTTYDMDVSDESTMTESNEEELKIPKLYKIGGKSEQFFNIFHNNSRNNSDDLEDNIVSGDVKDNIVSGDVKDNIVSGDVE